MSELPETEGDVSMLLWEFAGRKFCSQSTALTLAELIIKEFHGEDHLKSQQPLNISDGGDRWIIEGSRKGEDYPVPLGGIHDDRIIIEISKANCQVLKFAQMAW